MTGLHFEVKNMTLANVRDRNSNHRRCCGSCFLYEAELTRLGVRNALISRSGSSQISKLLLDLLQTLKPSFMQQLF